MNTAAILCFAMALDAAFGEPRWLWTRLPHPAILIGHAVGWLDRALNTGTGRRLRGIGAVIALAGAALLLGWILQTPGWFAETLVVAILLAQKSLVQHVRAVAQGLRTSPGDGRRAVAMIVGRDTSAMTPPDVARAAIESAAENLSDGVIAPAFWFLVAGLPGIVLYKVINTADSMIGHRTPRHAEFGWAAARLDDVLNLVPARLTALLIAVTGGLLRDWPAICKEAQEHRSPNAGWPEAAMARALDIALSGPRSYGGERRDFPVINPAGRRGIGASEIDSACIVLWRAWGMAIALGLLLAAVSG